VRIGNASVTTINQLFCDAQHSRRAGAGVSEIHATREASKQGARAPETGRSQMRVLLLAACVATLVIAGWSNYSTVADAKLRGDFTINPSAMMATTGQLPVEQYEAF